MDRPGRTGGRAAPDGTLPIGEVVPARAVLTELARGFLLAQASDPERAKRFASTFLRERAGPPESARLIPRNRLPAVRRGIDRALEGGGRNGR